MSGLVTTKQNTQNAANTSVNTSNKVNTLADAAVNTAANTSVMQAAAQPTAQISDTGKSAMGSPTKVNQNVPYSNGMAGVRQSLVNAGVSNDRIGWDGTNVTLDGKAEFTPTQITDGTSYASSKDINGLINKAYKNSGDEVVSAASYAALSGLGNLAKWDNESGTVSIGGTVIKPLYVSDGIAYVKKSEIDSAIKSVKDASGVSGPQSIYQAWRDKYGNEMDKAREEINNFHYDPSEDAEYQAYAAYQMREKEKLARDAASRAQDASGGYGGAAIAQAADSLYDSQQDIASQIPTYAEQAYNRKVDKFNNAITAGTQDYAKNYTAENDAYTRNQAALTDDYNRYNQEILNQGYRLNNENQRLTNEGAAYDNLMKKTDAEHYGTRANQTDRLGEAQVRSQELANESTSNDALYQLMLTGGAYNEDAAKNMGYTLPDGTFISYADIAANGGTTDIWNYPYKSGYMSQKGTADATNESNYEYAYKKLMAGL